VLEIDRNLKVTEAVIRYLIVKRDPRAVAAQRAREAQAAATPHPEVSVGGEAEAAEQVEETEVPMMELIWMTRRKLMKRLRVRRSSKGERANVESHFSDWKLGA
jgi:hypothetical protein